MSECIYLPKAAKEITIFVSQSLCEILYLIRLGGHVTWIRWRDYGNVFNGKNWPGISHEIGRTVATHCNVKD